MAEPSSGVVRTSGEIDAIAEAGHLVVSIIQEAFAAAAPGVTTASLAGVISAGLARSGAQSAIHGFQARGRSYPAVACISINNQLPAAVPSDRRLEPGDVLTIDLALRHNGWHADAATSRVVGENMRARGPALAAAREALFACISTLQPDITFDPVELADRLAAEGFGVAPGPLGHGIGRDLHEPPGLHPGRAIRLRPGFVLALEPIVSRGPWPGETPPRRSTGGRPTPRPDGWTTVSADGTDVWTEERTIAITAQGPRVLTRFPTDPIVENTTFGT